MIRRPIWVGAGFVALSSLSFSATTVSAVTAYGGGANPITVVAVRFLGAVCALALLLAATRAPLMLPPRERLIALGLGALLAVQSYFLYTSFDLIPAALTMVIFYIYPLLVGVGAALMGQERMGWPLAAGLAVAFAGLVLVFNVTGEGVNARGAVYAAIAAVAWAAIGLLSARLLSARLGGNRDSRQVTLHIQFAAAVLYGILLTAGGGLELPGTVRGWVGYVGAPIFYAVAITCFFAAVSVIGSVRTALIMNLEPVATIALAWAVLGQVLTGTQLVGAALVVAAVMAARWQGPRAASGERSGSG